ncbi:MAG: CoA transferase, partial [Brevundimonas sp.]
VADILDDPHIAARGNVIRVDDPELGPLRMQAPAGHMQRTPQEVRQPGPRVGQHGAEILIGKLGLDEKELREAGLLPDRA